MGLETAQAIGLINSAVLWQGQSVTLVGVNGANAYIETSNESRSVSLAELDLVTASTRLASQGETFRTPGVFRHQPTEEARVCSVDPEDADPSLNVCFDPSKPENLDEILRQTGSSDPTQQEEGRTALREAARQAREHGQAREFDQRVQRTLEEIGEENPCEMEGAQQAYEEIQNSLPPAPGVRVASSGGNNGGGSQSGNGTGNGVSNAGNGGGGGGSFAPAGNGTVLVAGAGGSLAPTGSDVVPASPANVDAGFVSLSPVVSFVSDVYSAVAGHRADDSIESGSAVPAVVSSASVPVALNPFTVPVPSFLQSSAIGALNAPRSSDPVREASFFQVFFGPALTGRPESDLMGLLVRPTASFAPKVYEVRRAVAEVIRTYSARYGTTIPADRASSLPITFRYNEERRRIEVSLDTAGSVGGSSESGSGASFDSFRGPFRSLAGFRLGSSDHLRGDEFGFGPIVAYVPVPAQYLQGVQLSGAPANARGDGRATDRGIERMVRRDSANDQHGGSRGDRDGRGSRGGRGGNRDGREDRDEENLYAQVQESDRDAIAA